MTTVYSGEFPQGNNPVTFTFGEPYEYQGGNIIIDCYIDGGSYYSFGITWDGASATAGSSIIQVYSTAYSELRAQQQSFLPKATFTYEGSGVSVDPTSLSFGGDSFYFGNTEEKNVTVSNSTDAAVAVSIDGDNADQFEIKNNVTSVAAGTTNGTITVVYIPTAAGTHTATLHVGNMTVALSGQAVTPPTPTIAVNPTTLNFGTVAVNSSNNTKTFTVNGTNLTSDITLTATGDYFSVSPTTIESADANGTHTITVTFNAPATAGTYSGTITIASEGAEPKTVGLSGTADNVSYSGTVETENGTLSLDFGTVNIGQTSEKLSIKVTNTGNTAFTPSFSIDNPTFSIEATRSITAGTSGYFDVTFTPAAAGKTTGHLAVTIGEQTFNVSLTGVGHEVPAYDITSSAASGLHDYGDVFKDGIATWSVTLTNNGKNSVTPTIEGLAAPFTTTYTPAALASGEKVTITIQFAPTALQVYGPQSIVVKFNETEDFQFKYNLRGTGIENTGTLPPSFYDGITYQWTDSEGTHTNTLSDVATNPYQMIALMREVYTNKNVPGNYYRGYKADGTVDTEYPVVYPAIGKVSRFGVAGVDANYSYNDAFGWGIPHDQANYPFDVIYTSSSSTGNDYKALNANEYKPNTEGLTMLLVELKDGVTSSTVSYDPENSSLVNVFSRMFKSVRVVPNSKKVTKNGVDGTLFKIDCDKMNRFFFLAKGRLRILGNVLDDHKTGRSNVFIDRKNNTSSSNSITNQISDKGPFYEMFEQFSPVSLSSAEESSDVYQELINMNSYPVEHDCEYIPWATATSTGTGATVTGHEFNMYGKTSTSEDCQDVRDLMFFVPDKRMMAWNGRDKSSSDKFVNYYEEYAPTMGMYVIRQHEITGEKIDGKNTYKLHLTWDSNLTDFVPADKGVYYIYLVNENGTYTKVGETNSQTKELYLDVDMKEHGQQVTYVIQGQDNTQFLSLQMSNEESFIIPGTNVNEKFQLDPNAEYYSRFNPANETNYYANGLQIKSYPDVNASDYAGKTLKFYRKAANATEWTHVASAVVNQSGTAATVSTVPATQRLQSEYIYGYKENATTATEIVFNNKTRFREFGIVFDNFKEAVAGNEHPDYYTYKAELEGTQYHSNEITVRVQKTKMSPIAGTFSKADVDADTKHTTGLVNKSFDVDVTYSSKTDVLRYDAYRWQNTADSELAILTGDADNEQDVAPQGIAGNQGEYYTVAMNSDYVGEDVYVSQGETAQATFVDNAATGEAGAYTYAPVVETFTASGDYNTYGAPLQRSATGTIGVQVASINAEGKQIEQSTYTWTENGQRYAYYNVYLDVNSIDIPDGYDLYKVRAWRKVDPSLLGEEMDDYKARKTEDGECLFEEITCGGDAISDAKCSKAAIQTYALGSLEKTVVNPLSNVPFKVWGATFGAKVMDEGDEMPMTFTVRAYFTRNENLTSGSSNAPRRAEGDAAVTDANGYYITETTVDFTAMGGPDNIITAVTDKSINREVKDVIYYNMTGAASLRPFEGVNVVVTRYTDGTTSTRKVIK
ncbi:MAG: choice-of-anchor D domain-containing protein [Muribaculaceae bacterium]|nr:choice-of-anchor D domain-containing protein [Muribaculaceae bacterium]